MISDFREGLDQFFDIGDEICCASTTDEVREALDMNEDERRRMGQAARARVLAQHTAMHRAQELEKLLA